MEEKKNNKGLIIGLIIFLVLCLIAIFYFMFKMVYVGPNNTNFNETNNNEVNNSENTNTNNYEILNLDNYLSLLPVKLINGLYNSYTVEELTDIDINDALCSYIYNSNEKITTENGVMLEKTKSADLLIKFLGLENYKINVEAGNNDIRYKLEEVKENEITYYKLSYTNISTDAIQTYTYKNLNSINYDEKTNMYIVKVEVIENNIITSTIGTADIYLKNINNDYTLNKINFQKYEDSMPEQQNS